MATRKRIQEIAISMGYRPDPLLQEMMNHIRRSDQIARRETLAFINFFTLEEERLTKVHEEGGWVHAAIQRADELGYKLEIFRHGKGTLTDKRLSNILWARGIRGVLVGPSPKPGQRLDLDWDRFAGLVLGHSVNPPLMDRIDNHHLHTVTTAVSELRKLGLQRIGLAITQALNERTEFQYTSAFLSEQMKWPAKMRVPLLIETQPSYREKAFVRWAKQHLPEAILIGTSDTRPLRWMRENGLQVPEKLSMVWLGVADASGSISGIYQDPAARISKALDFLAMKLQNHHFGVPERPMTLLLDGYWIGGKTTCGPKAPPPDISP